MLDSSAANPRKAVYEDEYKKKMEEYQEAKYHKHRKADWATFFGIQVFPTSTGLFFLDILSGHSCWFFMCRKNRFASQLGTIRYI